MPITITPNVNVETVTGVPICFEGSAIYSIPQEDARCIDLPASGINWTFDSTQCKWTKVDGTLGAIDAPAMVASTVYGKQPFYISAYNASFTTPPAPNRFFNSFVGVIGSDNLFYGWEVYKNCGNQSTSACNIATTSNTDQNWKAFVVIAGVIVNPIPQGVNGFEQFRIRSDGINLIWDYNHAGSWQTNIYNVPLPVMDNWTFYINSAYTANEWWAITTFRGTFQGQIPITWTTPLGGTLTGGGNNVCFSASTPGNYTLCADSDFNDPLCVNISVDNLYLRASGFNCGECSFVGEVVTLQSNGGSNGILTAVDSDGQPVGTVLNSLSWQAPSYPATAYLTYTLGDTSASCIIHIVERLQVTNIDGDTIAGLIPGESLQLFTNYENVSWENLTCANVVTPTGLLYVPKNPNDACFNALDCKIRVRLTRSLTDITFHGIPLVFHGDELTFSDGSDCPNIVDSPEEGVSHLDLRVLVDPIYPTPDFGGPTPLKWKPEVPDYRVIVNNMEGGCDETYIRNKVAVYKWTVNYDLLRYENPNACCEDPSGTINGINPQVQVAKRIDDFWNFVQGQYSYFTVIDPRTGDIWKKVRFSDQMQRDHVNWFTSQSRTVTMIWSPCCADGPKGGVCESNNRLPGEIIIPTCPHNTIIFDKQMPSTPLNLTADAGCPIPPAPPPELRPTPFYVSSGGPPGDMVHSQTFTSPETAFGQRWGLQDNDIAIILIESSDEDMSMLSAGFAAAPNTPVSNTTGPDSTRLSIFWKRISVTEGDMTTSDSTDHQNAVLLIYRGIVETGDPWDTSASSTGETGTSVTCPAVTTTTDGCLILNVATTSAPLEFNDSTFFNWQNSSVESLAENWDFVIPGPESGGAGSGGGLGVASSRKSTAGSVDATTLNIATSAQHVSWTGALKSKPVEVPEVVQTSDFNLFIAGNNYGFYENVQVNDVILLTMETVDEVVNLLQPDWTELSNSPVINTGQTRISAFWHRVNGTEEYAPVVDMTGDHAYTQVITFRGCVTSGSPWDTSAAGTPGNGASITVPGGTTTANNCLILNVVGRNAIINDIDWISAESNADLTSLTEQVAKTFITPGAVGNVGGGVALITGEKVTAGSFGSTSLTQTNPRDYNSWMGALKGMSGVPTCVHIGTGFPYSNGYAGGAGLAPDLTANDILILLVETPDTPAVVLAPSGWEEAPNSPVINNTGANPTRLSIFWKRSTGINIQPTNPGSYPLPDLLHDAVPMYTIFRGALETGDPFEVGSTGIGTGGSITIPGTTATNDNSLAIFAVSNTRSTISQLQTYSNWTNSDLTGLCELYERTWTNNGNVGGIGVAVGRVKPGGVFGATTLNQATSIPYAYLCAILKPKI